jgi:uncharacterized protein (TIGR00251 family)
MEDYILIYKEGEACLLRCYIQPGASTSELVGTYGNPVRLKLKIKAPPVKGKTNKEVISFLAKTFGLRKNQVELLRGELSRQKDFVLDVKRVDALRVLNSLF